MYSLALADGSTIDNLERLNQSTFLYHGDDPSLYWRLSDFNLSFATLYEDGEMTEILLDSKRQNYIAQNGIITFRLSNT